MAWLLWDKPDTHALNPGLRQSDPVRTAVASQHRSYGKLNTMRQKQAMEKQESKI